MAAIDILILSNGPGELATWVRPVVQELRSRLGWNRDQVRISLVLSPCPNASGQEVQIGQSYPEIDRVQGAEHFFPFLLTGRTATPWDWRPQGVVLFLGGDQFYPVVIGRRLGYRTVLYAEWEARWWRWIDRFGVMRPQTIAGVPPAYAAKFAVVGDLMAETAVFSAAARPDGEGADTPEELIGILPGSKPAKLAQGVPLMLAAAECIHAARPQTRFAIPVAPTLDLATLARFANAQQNPIVRLVNGTEAQLVTPDDPNERPYLKTSRGVRVDLWVPYTKHGLDLGINYRLMARFKLCITTVGANTAELGSLAIPMVMILPTQQLDAMRAWDGVPGILANLPGVGTGMAKLINWLALRRLGLLAWPNIWAKREIVPELVGRLQPEDVAAVALDWLNHPDKLAAVADDLRSVRGEPGAAKKLVDLVCAELTGSLPVSPT